MIEPTATSWPPVKERDYTEFPVVTRECDSEVGEYDLLVTFYRDNATGLIVQDKVAFERWIAKVENR